MNGVSVTAGEYSVQIDTSIYSLEAIKKTAYKFADRASVLVSGGSDSKVTVIFNFFGRNAKTQPDQVISDFCNELLDQDLREIVKRETGALRNLIIAHAFSRTSLSEKDE